MTDMNMGDGSNKNDQMELDALLNEWHGEVRERAREARIQVLRASQEDGGTSEAGSLLRNLFMNRYLPYAAMVSLVAMISVFSLPDLTEPAQADDEILMLPDGGRLDAFGPDDGEVGPCALKTTDVHASVSGHFVRVDVDQVFTNGYEFPIEAVYTFPLSHRGSVDRMTMTVRTGDEIRFIEGEIEERGRARMIYEEARDTGYVASLLEQERPNIFTQSIANIEPGAEITISISYIETVESTDGRYRIVFPTVVGPRYVPGYPAGGDDVPPGLSPRRGIVLRGPATLEVDDSSAMNDPEIPVIEESIPIKRPPWADDGDQPDLLTGFKVAYLDGSEEPGAFFSDGTGVVGGRWFCWEATKPGAPFAEDTNEVPDASLITPMPVRPGTRAGHDISIRVDIETGGSSITSVESPLHEIVEISPKAGRGSLGRRVFELASSNEIPNRDFVLEWTLDEDGISESVLAHTIDGGDLPGMKIVDGHLAVILNPPDRVDESDVPSRELVFVLDTSGSMRGFPIEKAKEVMTRAIDAMRPDDTFNLITFAGDTSILWEHPRPATEENRRAANDFIKSRRSGGGTEMMKAINTALTPTEPAERILGPGDIVKIPADGRSARLIVPFGSYSERVVEVDDDISFVVETTIAIPARPESLEGGVIHSELPVLVEGRWDNLEGRRTFVVDNARFIDEDPDSSGPMRIVVFMTDGYVGNDQAILASIRKNADTTRVFSFGIGNSVNRYLLDGMAEFGRGAADYLTLSGSSPREIVERFARRIQTPVLIDISMEFEGIALQDVLPSGGHLPDLYDQTPIVILARYQEPGEGTITIRGRTGSGPWVRTVKVELPSHQPENDVVATLWAREKVDEFLAPNLSALQEGTVDAEVKRQVIGIGRKYSIMTPFTSFVAVEKTRVISEDGPVLVRVPVELPSGTTWEGFFGDPEADPIDVRLEQLALGIPVDGDGGMDDDTVTERATLGMQVDRSPKILASPGRAAPPPPSSAAPRSFNTGGGSGLSRGRSAPGSAGRQPFFGGGGAGGRMERRGSREGANQGIVQRSSDDAMDVTASGEADIDSDDSDRKMDRRRMERLVRVLDRSLFRLAVREALETHEASGIDLGIEEMLIDSDGMIMVSIRIDPDLGGVEDRLRASGLVVTGSDSGKSLVIGRVSVESLASIGLLDGVLRVVPTTISPAS